MERHCRVRLSWLWSVLLFVSSTDAWAAETTKQQALAMLSRNATRKVEPSFLLRLFDQQANDVIVEFSYPPSTVLSSPLDLATTPRVRKEIFLEMKQQVVADLASDDYGQLRDYDALPMSFLRVKSRHALVRLLNLAGVKAIYENKLHTYTLAESLPLIRQPAAIATHRQGANTTVAILDTGVDYSLGAFGSCTAPGSPSPCRVVAALDTAPSDGVRDADGHGTNVAGIAAGVAPATQIAAIDVFNGQSAFTNDIIAGINWAIDNQQRYNIVAMNLSLGVRGVKYTSECTGSWATTPFANARAAGIVPVVAAGNDGFTDGVAEPACAPGAVRVGAVYDANLGSRSFTNCSDTTTAADKVTCFSNSGALLTLFAPGALISAAGSTYAGTSQAAPHVAGAVAILRASDGAPGDSIDQTISRLTSTGAVITDHRNGLQKPRLDLYAAVANIGSVSSPDWLVPVLNVLLLDD